MEHVRIVNQGHLKKFLETIAKQPPQHLTP